MFEDIYTQSLKIYTVHEQVYGWTHQHTDRHGFMQVDI